MDRKEEFLAQYGHEGHVDSLVNHKDLYVKLGLLDNPTVKPHHIETLFKHPDDIVSGAAAAHPLLPMHHIEKLINGSVSDREKAAPNPSLQPHHFDNLAKDRSVIVKSILATNPNLPGNHIDNLLDDPNLHYFTAESLAKHPKLTPQHFEKLVNWRDGLTGSNLHDSGVREIIAQRHDTPDHIIDKLRDDDSSNVRWNADNEHTRRVREKFGMGSKP
jgi:hypothetical protein